MLKIWKTLTWEFLAHAVHLSWTAVLVAILGPLFGWALTGFVEIEPDPQMSPAFPFYFSYVGIALFFYGAAAGTALAEMPKPARLHPVSSQLLATFFWLMPTCLIMLLNVITQLGYLIVFDTQWPILTTTVCLGTFSTVLMAAGWWLTTFRWRNLAVAGLIVSWWITWFAGHFYRDGWSAPMTVWNQFGSADLAVIVVTLGLTWSVTFFGLKKFRCGDTDVDWLMARMEDAPYIRAGNTAVTALPPVPDAGTAFLAMEWDRNRYVVRWLAALVMGLFGFALVLQARNGHGRADGLVALFSISSGYIGFAAGGWLGIGFWKNRSGELKSLHSTLPFSDAQLAGLLLRTWLKVTTSAWLTVVAATLILLAFSGVITGVAQTTAQFRSLWVFREQGWLAVLTLSAASFLIAWTLSGLTGSVLLTGRRWLNLCTFVGVTLVGVLLLLIYTYGGEPGQQLAPALLLGLVVLVAGGGTACVHIIAAVRHLLTGRQVGMCAVAMAVLCAVTWIATPATVYWKTIFTALACLSLAPIAGMPLALAWNRHR